MLNKFANQEKRQKKNLMSAKRHSKPQVYQPRANDLIPAKDELESPYAVNLEGKDFNNSYLNKYPSEPTGQKFDFGVFSPKRFNRYPRFTIFIKKGEEDQESAFVKENTVSLHHSFLTYLMNNSYKTKYPEGVT